MKDDDRIVPNMGYCIATNQVVKDNLKVRFMYRDEPDNDQDSGWRFFSGFEDDEYANNPANLAIYDVDTIVRIDKSILEYLDRPVGSTFEKPPETNQFTEIVDGLTDI